MTKIRIKRKDLTRMITEEYNKKIKEINLKKRLMMINEELEKLQQDELEDESESIEEVKAETGGKVRSTAWTGEKNGDEKYNPEFEKKGSHLVEDETQEEMDEELPTDDNEDTPGQDDEELELEIPSEDEQEKDIEEILANLATAIDKKIETTVDDKMNSATDTDAELDLNDNSENIDDKDNETESSDETDEINEQNGESVAQAQNPKNAVPFNNGKAEIPKNEKLISESAKKRYQILAGMRRNDFND